MTDLFLKKLMAIGLTEKEARIYLALLELEIASVYEIAKQSSVKRSSCYVVLEALKKKGLVGVSDDKKIRRYVAASPETILHMAEKSSKKQEEIKRGIESIIPELKALHKDTKRRPKIRIYEGKAGLIASFEDSLNCKEKTIRIISSVGKIFKLLPEYFPNYVKRRVEKGIKMYGIHPADKIAQQLIKADISKFDDPILIPKGRYKAPADMALYDDKIGYASPERGGFSIIIENKELAEVMKSIFDMARQEAKRLNKKLRIKGV